jgi:hypothetical protein
MPLGGFELMDDLLNMQCFIFGLIYEKADFHQLFLEAP